MKCPQCDKEMLYSYETHNYFSTGDEPDYECTYDVETYKCRKCNIVYVVNHEWCYSKINWDVPTEYLPSAKQFNAVKFINI